METRIRTQLYSLFSTLCLSLGDNCNFQDSYPAAACMLHYLSSRGKSPDFTSWPCGKGPPRKWREIESRYRGRVVKAADLSSLELSAGAVLAGSNPVGITIFLTNFQGKLQCFYYVLYTCGGF